MSELGTTQIVVCSLEPWGRVRRRMQLLAEELVKAHPDLNILFVEPPVDVPHALAHRRFDEVLSALSSALSPKRASPKRPSPKRASAKRASAKRASADVGSNERVRIVSPKKWLPRFLGSFADKSLVRQVRRAAKRAGMERPTLWVNDAHYARLVAEVDWPSLYDVTDDWLLSSSSRRARERLEADEKTLMERCDAVVVCSPALQCSRGSERPVVLIPNAVDADRFRRPASRPTDMPQGPVVLYAGTLHEDRLDVALCEELADALACGGAQGVREERADGTQHAHFVLVGPNSLTQDSTRRLLSHRNVALLGARHYDEIPGYLQHADVIVVPHVVTPFTESLDPIKAYECAAVGRPTVATPVPGFEGVGPLVEVAERDGFTQRVVQRLRVARVARVAPEQAPRAEVPTWSERAMQMSSVINEITSRISKANSESGPTTSRGPTSARDVGEGSRFTREGWAAVR